MKVINRAKSKVKIFLPDGVSEPEDFQPIKQRRVSKGSSKGTFSVETEIISALEEKGKFGDDNLVVVDRFQLDLGTASIKARTRGKADPEEIKIDVELDFNESAIVLIEQDVAYEWHYPAQISEAPISGSRGSRSGAKTDNIITFNIPIGDEKPPVAPKGMRRIHQGPITNFIKGKIKAFILKFIVRKSVGAISRRLEKGVNAGPVIISTAKDTEGWNHKDDFLSVYLPKDRPAKIVLLVHGTFSSTLGSFGALTTHPEGQEFLESCLQRYDAILGYDHYTLSETPDQNANLLFKDLNKLQQQSNEIEIDAISFSRGGLVYRYLTENLNKNSNLSFRKSIFIGCTNAGTQLANDENWKHLADYYTNMVVGSSKLIALIPGATLPATILRKSIQTIGSFVTYIAQEAVVENGVPGLASMEPDGKFVKQINNRSDLRKQAGAVSYYAIGSNFEPGNSSPFAKLSKRITFKVADNIVDKLMDEANDLVVNTKSMFVVDPHPKSNLVEKLSFDENDEIYHTVYFSQGKVALQCSKWLGIIEPFESEVSEGGNESGTSEGGATRGGAIRGGAIRGGATRGGATQDSSVKWLGRPEESFSPSLVDISRGNIFFKSKDDIADLSEDEEKVNTDLVLCYMHASMPEEAPINSDENNLDQGKVTVKVTLSREQINDALGERGQGHFTENQKIIIQIFALKNCEILGDGRAEIDLPQEKSEVVESFEVIPRYVGEGLIQVIARQGNLPIITLKLEPTFILESSTRSTKTISDDGVVQKIDKRKELSNVLYIFEKENNNQFQLSFMFESPKVLKGRIFCDSPIIKNKDAHLEFIQNLYGEIEKYAAQYNNRKDDITDKEIKDKYDKFMVHLRSRGSTLFNELIPKELRQALWEHKNEIKAIQVLSTEPHIPWEIAYITEPGENVVKKSNFLAEKGMVRWLAASIPNPPSELRIRDGKFSYIIPDYPEGSRHELPEAQIERKTLEKKYKAKPIIPTFTEVIDSLGKEGHSDILHFACHGIANSKNIWNAGLNMTGEIVDNQYDEEVLFSDDVKSYFNMQEPNQPGPIVFLNACQVGVSGNSLTGTGGFAEAFIKKGAGVFIGTHWSIGDKQALFFADKFYESIYEGKDIITAVSESREFAKNKTDLTWLSYVVYADPYAYAVRE